MSGWRYMALPVALGLTGSAFAQTAPVQPAITGGSIVQLLAGLAVVVGLVFALAWLGRRLTNTPGTGNGSVRIVSATAIGHRERVVVLEVGDRWLLVGVAPGQISRLHVMERIVPDATAVTPARSATFAAWLVRATDRRRA